MADQIPTGRIHVTPGKPDYMGYPKRDTYTWGEFAGMAIEMGGYGDISAIDPYSGARLTLFDAFPPGRTFLEAVRELLDAIEQTPRFLDPPPAV